MMPPRIAELKADLDREYDELRWKAAAYDALTEQQCQIIATAELERLRTIEASWLSAVGNLSVLNQQMAQLTGQQLADVARLRDHA